jgi:zinc-ribbon domain
VRCPHCGNENPGDHRFCGMCGKPLPESTAEISSSLPERASRHESPTPAPAYTGGIFNLGAPNDAPYQSLDYLLEDEDEPKSHTGLILVGLVALALVVGLGYLRFRNAGFPFPKPRSTTAQTAPAPNPADSSAPAADQPNAPAAQPAPPAATTPAPATQAPPNQASAPAPANPTPTPGTSPSAASESNTAATPANAAPAPANPPEPENSNDKNAEKESEAPANPAPAPAKPAEAVTPKPKPKPTPKPSDNVALGEQYLYGRGVPQNCERGLRYVKPAADQSNPKAMITMGALYATGHCISRDLPTAYRYFALALRLDPENGPLRQNAEMVWKQMTAEERKQAIRLTQ